MLFVHYGIAVRIEKLPIKPWAIKSLHDHAYLPWDSLVHLTFEARITTEGT